MSKLNLQIGSDLAADESGLVSGVPANIGTLTNKTVESVKKVINPARIMAENVIQTVRSPIDTLTNKSEAYRKLTYFLPATTALAIVTAFDKPLATVEKTLEFVNANIERGGEALKGISTKFLANLISKNGNAKWTVPKSVASVVEGTGDLLVSGAKLPFYGVEKLLNRVRNTGGYGTQAAFDKASSWVGATQLTPGTDYVPGLAAK